MKDVNGSLYILKDKAYPKHFMFGWTSDSKKKLKYHNSNRPYSNECEIIWESMVVDKVPALHSKIVVRLMDNIDYRLTGCNIRWHHIDNQEIMNELVQQFVKGAFSL